MQRQDVYRLIDAERAYQDSLWNEKTTISKGQHTFEEWIVYIEDYLAEAKHALSRNTQQEGNQIAADIMRKVAAMAVACMEQHDSPPRTKFRTKPGPR